MADPKQPSRWLAQAPPLPAPGAQWAPISDQGSGNPEGMGRAGCAAAAPAGRQQTATGLVPRSTVLPGQEEGSQCRLRSEGVRRLCSPGERTRVPPPAEGNSVNACSQLAS